MATVSSEQLQEPLLSCMILWAVFTPLPPALATKHQTCESRCENSFYFHFSNSKEPKYLQKQHNINHYFFFSFSILIDIISQPKHYMYQLSRHQYLKEKKIPWNTRYSKVLCLGNHYFCFIPSNSIQFPSSLRYMSLLWII